MTIQDINNKKLIATQEQLTNMEHLANCITQLENMYGEPFQVTSGLRTVQMQEKINPNRMGSAHLTGQAVDVLDLEKDVWRWLMSNIKIIKQFKLYLEDRTFTPVWVHIQTRPTNSGNIIFIP